MKFLIDSPSKPIEPNIIELIIKTAKVISKATKTRPAIFPRNCSIIYYY